jgi:hypothetical protein
MDIKQSNVFNFNSLVDGVNYGFTVQAETRELACSKLLKALESIIEELKPLLKSGAKPD